MVRALPALALLAGAVIALPITAAGSRGAQGGSGPAFAVTGYVSVGDVGSKGAIGRTAPTVTDFGIDGATVDEGGASFTLDPAVRSALGEAHAAGRPASLLLANYDGDLGDFSPARGAQLLRDAGHRASMVRALASEVQGAAWDGVTVDLESLEADDRAPLVAFVSELRAALPAEASLDVDVPAGESPDEPWVAPFDLPALSTAADRITLMAYDQHYAGGTPGPVAGKPWFRRVVAEALAQVPAAKVRIGVAGYGYRWRKGRPTDVLTVKQGRRLAGARARWDAKQGEWTARLPHGAGTIWWSDGRSVAQRTKLAKAAGAAGIALWRVGSADPLRYRRIGGRHAAAGAPRSVETR